MALEGTLADFNISQIFQKIGQQKKTGILTIYSGQDTITVSFHEGKIVAANSSHKQPEEKLGNLLVKKGYIDEATLDECLQSQQASFDRLGQILLKKKLVSKEQLQEALRGQIIQIVARLFSLEKGFYHFKTEDKIYFDEEYIIPTSVETILLEGVQQADELEQWSSALPSLDIVFTKTEIAIQRAQQDLKRMGDIIAQTAKGVPISQQMKHSSKMKPLSNLERQVLAKVDGARSAQEIVNLIGVAEPEAIKVIVSLLEEGMIQEVKPEDIVAEPEKPVADDVEYYEEFEKPPLISYIPFLLLVLVISGVIFYQYRWKQPVTSGEKITYTIFDDALMHITFDKAYMAVKLYYVTIGRLPEVIDDLSRENCIEANYLSDVFGNKLILTNEKNIIFLTSKGADGEFNTDDDLIVKQVFNGYENCPTAFFPVRVLPASQAIQAEM